MIKQLRLIKDKRFKLCRELVLAVMLKITLLWLIWFFCFSDAPHHLNTADVQRVFYDS